MTGTHWASSNTKPFVFAYGSNMFVPRMRDRIAAAAILDTGYVRGRRFAFDKRSADGSAKANAIFTGSGSDCVWGVIYRISYRDRIILDRYESIGVGYDREEVDVVLAGTAVRASMYVARSEAIDPALKPYRWYHQLVLHGAQQHGLPQQYIDRLSKVETVTDQDTRRAFRNQQFIEI